MQALIGSIQVVVSVFSMFFAITSAYIAGLYFFLNRAPLSLRLLAFFLLSVGLAFLGGSALIQQRLQEGLFAAWAKLRRDLDVVLRRRKGGDSGWANLAPAFYAWPTTSRTSTLSRVTVSGRIASGP